MASARYKINNVTAEIYQIQWSCKHITSTYYLPNTPLTVYTNDQGIFKEGPFLLNTNRLVTLPYCKSIT